MASLTASIPVAELACSLGVVSEPDDTASQPFRPGPCPLVDCCACHPSPKEWFIGEDNCFFHQCEGGTSRPLPLCRCKVVTDDIYRDLDRDAAGRLFCQKCRLPLMFVGPTAMQGMQLHRRGERDRSLAIAWHHLKEGSGHTQAPPGERWQCGACLVAHPEAPLRSVHHTAAKLKVNPESGGKSPSRRWCPVDTCYSSDHPCRCFGRGSSRAAKRPRPAAKQQVIESSETDTGAAANVTSPAAHLLDPTAETSPTAGKIHAHAVPYHRGRQLKEDIVANHKWLEARMHSLHDRPLSPDQQERLSCLAFLLEMVATELEDPQTQACLTRPVMFRSLGSTSIAALPSLPLLDDVRFTSDAGCLNLRFLRDAPPEAVPNEQAAELGPEMAVRGIDGVGRPNQSEPQLCMLLGSSAESRPEADAVRNLFPGAVAWLQHVSDEWLPRALSERAWLHVAGPPEGVLGLAATSASDDTFLRQLGQLSVVLISAPRSEQLGLVLQRVGVQHVVCWRTACGEVPRLLFAEGFWGAIGGGAEVGAAFQAGLARLRLARTWRDGEWAQLCEVDDPEVCSSGKMEGGAWAAGVPVLLPSVLEVQILAPGCFEWPQSVGPCLRHT